MPDRNRNCDDIPFFHNQKTGEFDAITGEIYLPGSKKEIENTGRMRREEVREKNTETKRHLENMKENISRVETVSGKKEDEEILQKQKQQALKLIEEVERSAEEYVEYVYKRGGMIAEENYSALEDLIRAKEESDEFRSKLHDHLIDSIRIANRNITYNFGILSPEQIEFLAEKEEAAGRKFIEVKRFQIPRNGICSEKVNLKDRDSIAIWAEQLVS